MDREQLMTFRTLLAFTAIWLAAGTGASHAERPLTIVAAYSAGGSTDVIARLIGARLQEKLGRPVIIEDKPGATGQIGSRYVARSEPDGNTIQIAAQTTHAVAQSLFSHLDYDPVKDFTPIILVAWSPLVLVCNPALPVSSVKELIDYLKSRPGAVNYATGGRGDASHLAALLFNKLAGVNPVAVPYQGDGQAVPQLLGNHVPYMFVGIPPASGSIQSGALRALAVTSKVRSPILPDVPTIQESGLPEYEIVLWWGFFAPAGMAPELVTKFNKVIGEIIQEPETRGKLRQLGYETTGSTPEEFKAYLQSEIAKWGDLIKTGGLDTE
jgi:tripartite-type tricarboxylate transporter receptor subunit TctC